MQIYLQHEIHGRKIAYMEMEAEFDEKNGWVRYTLDTPVEAAPVVNELEVKRRRSRSPEVIEQGA
jgi:hypothetical protein